MRILLLLSLFLFVFSSDEKTFQFGEIIKGEWEIEKHIHVKIGENSSFITDFLNITSGALPDIFIGAFKDNQKTIQTKIECETDYKGSFKLVEIESKDFDELIDFEFEFKKYGGHKIYISDGTFKGSLGKGIFEFIISSPLSWTLTLYPTSPTKIEIIRYVAKKIVPEATQSFFQRYGFLIMIMAMFYSTRFLNFGNKK